LNQLVDDFGARCDRQTIQFFERIRFDVLVGPNQTGKNAAFHTGILRC
jgi:hypothetical protein